MKNLEGLFERYRLEAGAAGHTPKTMDDVVRPVQLFSEFVGDLERIHCLVEKERCLVGYQPCKGTQAYLNHS